MDREAAVLAAVIIRLRLDSRIAWFQRMNTGATLIGNRFIRFGFRGCSDIIGQTKSGKFLAIEVKRPSGVTTQAQEAFLEQVRANGGIAGVVRSSDDVEGLFDGQK